jgi:glycosyltransferase involved in cell wall biosynthesis
MNIIYLGCNGFPYGFAEVQKQKMISKSLVSAGASVTIINTKGVFTQSQASIKYKGRIEGINYIYTSLSSVKPEHFFTRNLMKFSGKIGEVFNVFYLRKRKQKNIAILSTQNIFALIYYYYLLKLAGYKTVLSYEEFVKNLNIDKNKKGLHLRFDDIAHRFCDAFLPISAFLTSYQNKLNPRKALFRIPALTDFDMIDAVTFEEKRERTILFCGASIYFENINFIIDAFELLVLEQVCLVLIIHGNADQNQKIFDRINKSAKKSNIKVFSNLSSDELFRKYKETSLLLIPLKPYERDIARFPHKISEYTAAKTPIVTTAVGEINQYFTDGFNAFVAEHYNVAEFASKISFGLNNGILCKGIADKAYQLGRMYFHYGSISNGLFDFFKDI